MIDDIKDYFFQCSIFDWHFEQDDTYPSRYKENMDKYQDLIQKSRNSEDHRKVFEAFIEYKYGNSKKPALVNLNDLLSHKNNV